MEDWFFGHQFLNGANPTLIRRCTEIPPNMAVTEETVGASLGGGASLCQEMEVIEWNQIFFLFQSLSLTPHQEARVWSFHSPHARRHSLSIHNQILPTAMMTCPTPPRIGSDLETWRRRLK